jgi:hypothetical protein
LHKTDAFVAHKVYLGSSLFGRESGTLTIQVQLEEGKIGAADAAHEALHTHLIPGKRSPMILLKSKGAERK